MAVCPTCHASYESTVRICPKDGTPLPADPVTDPNVGSMLEGKYRIDGFISSGGMGSVYRGTHVMLDKKVAIKLIKKELVTSPDVAVRFQREARAASNLGHPNIAAVSDFGQTAEGTLYLVMEYINGSSLRDVIQHGGPMAPDRIVRILQPITQALARAHRHHVIHRDLKPHNIMLDVDADGTETPKLLDFGIAKTFDDSVSQLTMTGYALGTPQYMSPEQATGRAVDGRSDIYSLGVVLYEMLIGEVPFSDTSLAGVLLKQMTESPVPPSVRRPDVPISPALEAIAMRCLEKDPANRYQSADEVFAALQEARAAGLSATDEATVKMPVVGTGDATIFMPRTASTPAPTPTSAQTSVRAASSATPAAGTSPIDPTVLVPPSASGTRPSLQQQTVVAPPSGTASSAAATSASQPAASPASLNAPSTSQVATPKTGTTPTMVAPVPPAPAAPMPAPAATSRSSGASWVPVVAIAALIALGFGVWTLRQSLLQPAKEAAMAPASTPASAQAPATPEAPASTAPTTAPAAAPTNVPASESTRSVAAPTPAVPPAAPPASSVAAPATASTRPSVAAGSAAAPASKGAAAVAPASRPAQAVAPPSAAAPAAPALPENPTVFVQCSGPGEVCSPMRSAFSDAIAQDHMTLASAAGRADVVLNVSVEVIEERASQSFGTTFVTRTYSAEVNGDARGAAVPMPQGRTFSFDARVGRERANENARLLASDAVERVRAFWQKSR